MKSAASGLSSQKNSRGQEMKPCPLDLDHAGLLQTVLRSQHGNDRAAELVVDELMGKMRYRIQEF